MLIISLLAILIGIALGFFGGGGAILTVPLLHYGLDMPLATAITTSLIIIGIASLISTLQYARHGHVDWRLGLIMGSTGMVGALLGARLTVYLPEQSLLLLLAAVMIASGIAMLCKRGSQVDCAVANSNIPLVKTASMGLIIGLFTGMVGAGGGFLVVPALILLGGLSVQLATGTSLFVITLNSSSGILGHINHTDLNYQIIAITTVCAIFGAILGSRLALSAKPEQMRKGFAGFILLIAAFLILKELPIVITQTWYISHWFMWSIVALSICSALLYFLTTTCLSRIWRLPLFSLLLIPAVQHADFLNYYYF